VGEEEEGRVRGKELNRGRSSVSETNNTKRGERAGC